MALVHCLLAGQIRFSKSSWSDRKVFHSSWSVLIWNKIFDLKILPPYLIQVKVHPRQPQRSLFNYQWAFSYSLMFNTARGDNRWKCVRINTIYKDFKSDIKAATVRAVWHWAEWKSKEWLCATSSKLCSNNICFPTFVFPLCSQFLKICNLEQMASIWNSSYSSG